MGYAAGPGPVEAGAATSAAISSAAAGGQQATETLAQAHAQGNKGLVHPVTGKELQQQQQQQKYGSSLSMEKCLTACLQTYQHQYQQDHHEEQQQQAEGMLTQCSTCCLDKKMPC